MEVSLDASGSITRLEPRRANKIMHSLLDAAKRTWTFVLVRVAGRGVGSRALVPIRFIANVRKPDPEECKLPSELGGASFESGSSIALESRVTLKSGVIGKSTLSDQSPASPNPSRGLISSQC